MITCPVAGYQPPKQHDLILTAYIGEEFRPNPGHPRGIMSLTKVKSGTGTEEPEHHYALVSVESIL
jgi:hypothetical protein